MLLYETVCITGLVCLRRRITSPFKVSSLNALERKFRNIFFLQLPNVSYNNTSDVKAAFHIHAYMYIEYLLKG